MTQAERIKHLESEIDRLTTASAQQARTIGDLTAQRDAAVRDAHAAASDRDTAVEQLRAAQGAQQAPAPPPAEYEVPEDEPRWLYAFRSGMLDPISHLAANLAEEQQMQAAEPDTWFRTDVEAAAGRRRREER